MKAWMLAVLAVFLVAQLVTAGSELKFTPRGDDEYTLEFTNQLNQSLVFPLISNQGGIFKYGDNTNDFVFIEGYINPHATHIAHHNFTIGRLDYFMLSSQTKKNDVRADTHIMRYNSIDTANKQLQFDNFAIGTVNINYSDANIVGVLGQADFVVEGKTYKIYIANLTSDTGDHPLAIDMNTDGVVNWTETQIVTVSGEIYDLGNAYESIGASVIPNTNVSGYVRNDAGVINTPFVTIQGFIKKHIFGGGTPRGNIFGSIIINATENSQIDIPRVFGEGRLIEQNGTILTAYNQSFILQERSPTDPATFIVRSPERS